MFCENCDLKNKNNNSLCWKCSITNQSNYHRNYYVSYIKKWRNAEYINEFIKITSLKNKYLTTKGFDELSNISSMGIIKGLGLSWKELLEEFDLLEDLYDYAVEEYKKHAYDHGKSNSTKFVNEHHFLRQYIFSSVLEMKEVRNRCGFINIFYSGQYNEHLLIKEFERVSSLVGGIPSVNQFLKHGKILPSIYCDYFGIKGQQWDEVLKKLIKDKNQLRSYFFDRAESYKNNSINALRKYKEKSKIPLTKLEEEFKRVFDYFILNFNTHPTRRMFNSASKFNEITYRKRFGIRWSEVIEFYGYKIKEKNIAEKVFLELIKGITNTNYQRNKTWSWLKGIYNKNLYCDGYFIEINLIVEFDGRQHRTPVPEFGGYERFLIIKENDEIKEKLVKEKGYKFLRVSSSEDWGDRCYLIKRLEELGIDVDESN